MSEELPTPIKNTVFTHNTTDMILRVNVQEADEYTGLCVLEIETTVLRESQPGKFPAPRVLKLFLPKAEIYRLGSQLFMRA